MSRHVSVIDQGPVARSLVSANHLFRSIETRPIRFYGSQCWLALTMLPETRARSLSPLSFAEENTKASIT